MPILEVKDLVKSYGERNVLDGISFDLQEGETKVVMGASGCGKSTLLRCLNRLIEPTSGTILFEGEDVTRADTDVRALRSRIGFLTESPGLWDRLTVYDNLLVYARLQGVGADAIQRVLDLFGIGNRAGDQAAQLSKGLKQRVALARTLLHDPSIVLLDEPTAGLDPESAHETRALIVRLKNERRTVVISTHNLDEVERIADRVAVLRSRLIALDTPDALRSRLFGRRVSISRKDSSARRCRVRRQRWEAKALT